MTAGVLSHGSRAKPPGVSVGSGEGSARSPTPTLCHSAVSVKTGGVECGNPARCYWRPSLSTGLVFRYRFQEKDDAIGVGVGVHFVFVPKGTSDASRAAPALTIHVGKAAMHVFAGIVIMPTDDAILPNNAERVVAPASFSPASSPRFSALAWRCRRLRRDRRSRACRRRTRDSPCSPRTCSRASSLR